MKILGIVASCRNMGNTEILVKEALMAAEEKGAEVDIIRWNDFNIMPCEGDASCIFGTNECKQKDDHDFLLKKCYEFDGVILGAPCYFLEAQAILKQFIDRLFILLVQPSQLRGKPAAIIVPYATRGWTSYAFLQPTILLHQLGMDVIDKQLIHIQAMSEAVIDKLALDKARNVGTEVAEAVTSGNHSYKGDPGVCPVCHERTITILKDDTTVECGICGIRGTIAIKEGKIHVDFPQEQLKWHRFSYESMYRHVTYEIQPSKEYFMRQWPTIKETRGKYKDYLDIRKQQKPENEKR
jgi:multimeric flavodoxin WrbA